MAMAKGVRGILVGAVACAAFAACASRQQTSDTANQAGDEVGSTKQGPASNRVVAAGRVTEVTPYQITLQPPAGDPLRVWLNDQTRVQVAGRQATANEIREGSQARVSYEFGTEGPTAVSVSVLPSGTAPATGGTSGSGSRSPANAPARPQQAPQSGEPRTGM